MQKCVLNFAIVLAFLALSLLNSCFQSILTFFGYSPFQGFTQNRGSLKAATGFLPGYSRLDELVAFTVELLAWLVCGFSGLLKCFTEFVNRSEEHTSELQSRGHLVCRLL